MPFQLAPMLATATTDLPRDDGACAFEMKWDGMRVLLTNDDGIAAPGLQSLRVLRLLRLVRLLRLAQLSREVFSLEGLRYAMLLSVLTAIGAFAALGGFLFLSTLYLQDVRDMSALVAGLHMVPMASAMAVGAVVSSRILARRGGRLPTVAAGAGIAVGGALLTIVLGPAAAAIVMTAIEPSTQSQLAWPLPAQNAADALTRLAAVTPKQPSAILVMVDGSVPRAACRAHNVTTNGVKAKIMNGLKARNDVVGICSDHPNRSRCRSTWLSIHRMVVLPICS